MQASVWLSQSGKPPGKLWELKMISFDINSLAYLPVAFGFFEVGVVPQQLI